MATINWKTGRWISLIVAVLSGLFFLGVAQSLIGMTIDTELVAGIDIGMALGIANLFVVWVLYKVL